MLHTATRFSRSSDSVFCVMQSGISLLDNGRLKPRHYREGNMSLRQVLFSTVGAIGLAAMAVAVPAPAGAQQAAVQIDNDDIGGGVTGASGREAGVWGIAGATGLPTKYAKIVVADGQGRYVIPDPRKAKYQGV